MNTKVLQLLFFVVVFSAFVSARTIYESRPSGRFEQTALLTIDSTSDSLANGMMKVAEGTTVLGKSTEIKSLNGAFIMDASTETAHGFGLSDTVAIYLETIGLGFAATILDSVRQINLPCTLWVNLANVNDTLFKEEIQVRWIVYDTSMADSLVDSVTTKNGVVIDPYNMRWYLIGRD